MLKAPFPYFGGKSQIAEEVWKRLGDAPTYVEPFFGSGAVLLSRQHQWWDRHEIVNDLDCFVANYWRATQADPDAVALHANWPSVESDVHARHYWLVNHEADLRESLEGDPDYYDARAAGWWVWGICNWIGSGWCSGRGPWHVVDGKLVKPDTSLDESKGISRQLLYLGGGRGINRKIIRVGQKSVVGINRKVTDKMSNASSLTEVWSSHVKEIMAGLSDRLRQVRICCGDWTRVCPDRPTMDTSITAYFLDPPYELEGRTGGLYTNDTLSSDISVAAAVRNWAVEQGKNNIVRVALCGYQGDYEMPSDWEALSWKAKGGYSGQGDGHAKENATREMIWFSPYCIRASELRRPLR